MNPADKILYLVSGILGLLAILWIGYVFTGRAGKK